MRFRIPYALLGKILVLFANSNVYIYSDWLDLKIYVRLEDINNFTEVNLVLNKNSYVPTKML